MSFPYFWPVKLAIDRSVLRRRESSKTDCGYSGSKDFCASLLPLQGGPPLCRSEHFVEPSLSRLRKNAHKGYRPVARFHPLRIPPSSKVLSLSFFSSRYVISKTGKKKKKRKERKWNTKCRIDGTRWKKSRRGTCFFFLACRKEERLPGVSKHLEDFPRASCSQLKKFKKNNGNRTRLYKFPGSYERGCSTKQVTVLEICHEHDLYIYRMP